MTDEPVSQLEYGVSAFGFGGPLDVKINGQTVEGVQSIEVREAIGEYSTVVIRLGGVAVTCKTDDVA